MRKISAVLLAILICSIFFVSGSQNNAFAAACTATYSPITVFEGDTLTITVLHQEEKSGYNIFLTPEGGRNINPDEPDGRVTGPENDQTAIYTFSNVKSGRYLLVARDVSVGGRDCLRTSLLVSSRDSSSMCVAWIGESRETTSILEPGSQATFYAEGPAITEGKSYQILIDNDTYTKGFTISYETKKVSFVIATSNKRGNPLPKGSHVVTLQEKPTGFLAELYKQPTTLCSAIFGIGYLGAPVATPTLPCADRDRTKGNCTSVSTALGSINPTPTGFIQSIFSLLLGLAGGIAAILIIVSGYRLMASQGNPEQVQGAREMLTSAVVGLLFIIFSLVILQVIGVDILQIPGFK